MLDRPPDQLSRVSGEARAISALLPALSPDELNDLKRLIQARLTSFNEHQRRFARLGLLVEMVCTRSGEVPETGEYEGLRKSREREGEEWEHATTLSRAYGCWPKAVRAAMRLAFDGSSARVPSKYRTDTPPAGYTPDEAVNAFLKCLDVLAVWPTEPEYEEWRRLANDLARVAGNRPLRYPSRAAWLRLFGSWQAFEATARRQYRSRSDEQESA